MYELVFNIIGAFGFAIAVASFMWQVRTYKAERIEKVAAHLTASFGFELWGMDERKWSSLPPGLRDSYAVSALHLQVVNIGQMPLYIKDVVLCSGDEPNALGSVLCEHRFKPSSPADDGRLAPSEGRTFVLPISFAVTEEVSGGQAPRYWIAVRSTKGEVYREEGSHVWSYVKQCADMHAGWQEEYHRRHGNPGQAE